MTSMMDGLWSAWMFLPPALWAGLIGVLLLWMLATTLSRRPNPVRVRSGEPEERLRERLARGEISFRQYEEALAYLRSNARGSRNLRG